MNQIAQLFHQMRESVSMNKIQKSRRYPTSISSFHMYVSLYPWTVSHTCVPTKLQTCISMHTQHTHFPRGKKPKISPFRKLLCNVFQSLKGLLILFPVVCQGYPHAPSTLPQKSRFAFQMKVEISDKILILFFFIFLFLMTLPITLSYHLEF